MFEFHAQQLKVGDEFTTDHGETWHTASEVDATWQDVVVTSVGGVVFEFHPRDLVIVR